MATPGKFVISQNSTYAGDDWWNWEVWIEGKDSDLDTIEYVVYTLHSTFVKPVRKISDRSSKFILKEEGWGTFTIYCKLFLKNNSTIQLQHDLVLLYPGGEKLVEQRNKSVEVKEDIDTAAKGKSNKIFIFLGLGLILAFLLFMLIRPLNKSNDQNIASDTTYGTTNSSTTENTSNTSNTTNNTITTTYDSVNSYNPDAITKDYDDSLKFNDNHPELTKYPVKRSVQIDEKSTRFNYNLVYKNNGDTSLANAKNFILKQLRREMDLIKTMDEDEFRKKYSIQRKRNQ